MSIELSNEFWAGVSGALVGSVVSGLISYVLQAQAFAREEKKRESGDSERKLALCMSALLKCMKAYSNLVQMNRHMQTATAEAKQKGAILAQVTTAMVNLPSHINFTSDELTTVLSLASAETFNDFANVDGIHNSCIDIFDTHRNLRKALEEKLRVLKVRGNIAEVELSPALRIELAAIDSLLNDMAIALPKDVEDVKRPIFELRNLIESKLNHKLALAFNDDKPSEAKS